MRKIFEKLNAHPERVELAQIKNIGIAIDSAVDLARVVRKDLLAVESKVGKNIQLMKIVDKEIADVKQKAKELGIDIPELKQYESQKNELEKTYRNVLSDVGNAISSL